MREKTFEELVRDADFDVSVRFNHLDDTLCEIDESLMELYVDQICTEIDIIIARELEESTVILRAELDEIEKNIDYLLHKYEIVCDMYDEVLFEILGGLNIAK
ncbi:MAG: hypothetical protein M0Q88_08450 [Bacilli bacterium]|nr:hypothetical protein [Bacilli bacterium]